MNTFRHWLTQHPLLFFLNNEIQITFIRISSGPLPWDSERTLSHSVTCAIGLCQTEYPILHHKVVLVMNTCPIWVGECHGFHLSWKEQKHYFLWNINLIQYNAETATTFLPLPWVNPSGNGAKIKEAEPGNRERKISSIDLMSIPETKCFWCSQELALNLIVMWVNKLPFSA